MSKAKSTTAAVVSLLIILGLALGFGSYFAWTTRGDVVQYSSRGDLGWGSKPVRVHSGSQGTGPLAVVATAHSFGFVRDIQYLASQKPQSEGVGAPASTTASGQSAKKPLAGAATSPGSPATRSN
jgi:hypothetical protein